MTISLLQRGTGTALVVYAAPVVADVGTAKDTTTAPSSMPPAALAALGPAPTVIGVNASGPETPEQIKLFAETATGRSLWWACLIGYSRGCQRVRGLWLAGADALALVLGDGMAGQKPPTQEQLSYAQSIVQLAEVGAIVCCILHTYIEPGPSVISTATMARLATGWALRPPPQHQTVRRIQVPADAGPGWHGGLAVYSMGSGPGDKQAHRDIASVILPLALQTEVRGLVDLEARPSVTISELPASSPEPPPEFAAWTYPILTPKPATLKPAAQGTPVLQAPAPPVEPTVTPAPDPAPVPGPPAPPSTGGARVLLIGDSLATAEGLGSPLKQLAQAVGLPFEGAGVKSATIRDWVTGNRKRGVDLQSAIALADPTYALVCLGTNPGEATGAAEGLRAGELIDTLRRNGVATVAWIAPPRLKRDMNAFRAALEAACSSRDVRIFDTPALDLERAGDGIHMTPKGYRAWADAIAAWVPFASLAAGAALPGPGPEAPPPPATPAGLVPLRQSEVTPEMATWAKAILHDQTIPMGGTASKTFGARSVLAKIEVHPRSAQIDHPHRGVSLYDGGTAETEPYSDAPVLLALREQLDRGWPQRQKAGGGIRASVAHDARNPTSDHHLGDALDVPADTAHGPNLDQLATALIADPRVKYVIWHRRVANNTPSTTGDHHWAAGEWRRYPTDYMVEHGSTNVSPHDDHLHVSIYRETRDDRGPFRLASVDPPGRWAPSATAPAAVARATPDGPTRPHAAATGHVQLRERFVVSGLGEMGLDDYVAHVVTGEMGRSRQIEALKAQAIAARTFVQHALHNDRTLGTAANPVQNSELFQVAAPEATPLAQRVAQETHGGVALYRGKLILASYVNGAPWAQGAWKGVESAKYPLERWVTYNEGLSGASVHPTYRFGPRPQPSNRGDMSQNGADALAARGYHWPGILRFFYGADLEVTLPEPADARGPRGSESTSSSSSSAVPLVLAAVLAAYGATRGFS